MAHSRTVTLLGTAAMLSLALSACGSSSKSDSTTSTTKSSGGVTVTTSSGGSTVEVVLGDTKGVDGPMTLAVTPTSTKAGDVTFNVKNSGTIEHEMIVLKTDNPFDKLPVVDAGDPPVSVATGADKVDEADNVGETGEPNLAAGVTRAFTVKGLDAGSYVLMCNIAKHYGLGMRAAFTVS
jgi:uncharacterized cupredoxin-like copper-binding protein